MGRMRTVKPEFWDDEKIGELSRDARLLFLATFNMADDEALLRWSSAYLKSEAFKYDDDLSVDDVDQLMAEIVDLGLALPYQAGGRQRLAWIVSFPRHQKVNRPQPSKLTPPPIQSAVVMEAYARRDRYVCHLCGGDLRVGQQPGNTDERLAVLNLALDHLTHRRAGGTDHPTNIRAAHAGCVRGRGGTPAGEFVPPDSVTDALAVLDSVSGSLNDSVNDSVSHSVNPDRQTVTMAPSVGTQGEFCSVNDSVNDSQQEGKGEGREKEEEHSCVADATTESEPTSSTSKWPNLDAKFDEFWAAWPRKIAKPDAKNRFMTAVKSKKADPVKIVQAAKAQAAAWTREGRDKQYIPHPATWLNRGSYDDEIEPNLRLVSGGYVTSRPVPRDPNTGARVDF